MRNRAHPRCSAVGSACFLRFEGREPVFGTCVSVDCVPIADGEWSTVPGVWCAKTSPARVDPEIRQKWIEHGRSTCPDTGRTGSDDEKSVEIILLDRSLPEEVQTYDCSATLWERVEDGPTAVVAILWRDETGRAGLIGACSVFAGLVLGIFAYRRRD